MTSKIRGSTQLLDESIPIEKLAPELQERLLREQKRVNFLVTTDGQTVFSHADFAPTVVMYAYLNGALMQPDEFVVNTGNITLAVAASVSDQITVLYGAQGIALPMPEPGSTIISVAYDNRADLRANITDTYALVDGLGFFEHVAGSDEPDDDESCFATTTGRWLLQAAHWDLVSAWQAPDDAVREEDDEDESLRFVNRLSSSFDRLFTSNFDSSFARKVLTGTATCAITSLTTVTSASFTGTVAGAAVGDRVIATPPGQLGSTAADTGRLSYHAWVSAADTVTVMLTNASAATATTNAAIRTAWPITVIKS